MAALFCRRRLLAHPIQFLPTRLAAASLPTPPIDLLSTRVAAASLPTPPIDLLSTRVAAASLPTPPAHFLLTRVAAASLPTVHPHCPISPRSTSSAASMSARISRLPSLATRSAASMSSRTSRLLSPATRSAAPISARISPPPSRTVLNIDASSAPTPHSPFPAVVEPHLNFGAVSVGPDGICGTKVKGRFGAVSAGPHGICGSKVKGRRAQPSFMLAQNRLRTFSSDQKVNPSKAFPVRQLAFRDDSQAAEEIWIDLTEYLKHHSLVVDARKNHLNMEISGFGDKGRYNLSEDAGIPLCECLVLLALANNNRGYCVKRSFTKDNLLVCPRLKQLMFKSVMSDDLEAGPSDCNRAASYAAVANLMVELLMENVGPDVISQLLEEPRDLISKLEQPSDEKLIVYHPTFLSMDGRIWYYEKLYRLVFKVFPSKDLKFRSCAEKAVADLAYTRGNLLVTDIIKSHPLLSHIESGAPTDRVKRPKGVKRRKGKKGKLKLKLGKKIVALHRHTIVHAFDSCVKKVRSNQHSSKKLWPYSIDQVVDFLKSVMPLHLLKSQEVFLSSNLWHHLNIDRFWPRNLAWIGGVPEPSKEGDAIKMVATCGKRRIQARKPGQDS